MDFNDSVSTFLPSPNSTVQRKSIRLASRQELLPSSSSPDLISFKKAAFESNNSFTSRPKKKRYSVDQNEFPVDSLSESPVTCQAIVKTNANLLKRRNVDAIVETGPVETKPKSSLQQNFKQFRKQSLSYERTSSLESLENGNISLILTSPEWNQSDTKAQEPKKTSKKKISDFFEKEETSPTVEQKTSDDKPTSDQLVVESETECFVPMRRTPNMGVFSELFKNASVDKKSMKEQSYRKKTFKKNLRKCKQLNVKPQLPEPPFVSESSVAQDSLIDFANTAECLEILSDEDTIILGNEDNQEQTSTSYSKLDSQESRDRHLDNIWVHKHCPKDAKESICSRRASKMVKDWISDFERKNAYDSCSDSDYEYDEERDLCLLIAGPTGCGKTSLVYAVAHELGYKVFELNCSSKRTGKVVNQLKEATLSHTVSQKDSGERKNSMETATNFFSRFKDTPLTSHLKVKSTKSSTKSIASFFNTQSKSVCNAITPEMSLESDSSILNCENNSQFRALKLDANCIILIDDADIIFEEDSGFWASLNFLIEKSHKPVVLTATCNIEGIRSLLKNVNLVELDAPKPKEIERRLLHLSCKEVTDPIYQLDPEIQSNLTNEQSVVNNFVPLIRRCCTDNVGDIRKAINLLQFELVPVLYGKTNLPIEESKLSIELNVPSEGGDEDLIGNHFIDKFHLKRLNLMSINDVISSEFQLKSYPKIVNGLDEINTLLSWHHDFHSRKLAEEVVFLCDSNQSHSSSSFSKCQQSLNTHLLFSRHLNERLSVSDNQMNALQLDYLPYLSWICRLELERLDLYRTNTRKSRRFLHYLDSNSIIISDECKAFLLKYFD